MRQGFYTHSRIKEELAEEDSPHLDRPITRWHSQASQIFRWEHIGVHLLRQVVEELVC